MKIFVLSLLALFALGSAQDCSDERVEACLENLISSLSNNTRTSEEEVCGKLQASFVCLRNASDECLEEEDEDVEEGLELLEEILSNNCEQGEVDEMIKKCLEAYEEYISSCLLEGAHRMLIKHAGTDRELNKKEQCLYHRFVVDCSVEIAEDRCGAEVASIVKEQFNGVSAEILEVCEEDEELDEMMKKCFEANRYYIIGACFYEGQHQLLYELQEMDHEPNEMEQRCLYHSFVVDCSVEIAEDKCGEEVASIVKREFNGVPAEIVKACEEAEEVDEGDEMIKECLEANKNYINDCLYEGALQMLDTLAEKCSELNKNEQKCLYHSFVVDCSVERAEEKCGEEVASIVKKEFDVVPAEIVEACEEAALGGTQVCSDECFEMLLESLLGATNEDEVCEELQDSIVCLRNAEDECPEEEYEDVLNGLRQLEDVFYSNCEQREVDKDHEIIKECYESHEDYLSECIYEGTTQALTKLMEKGGEVNENALQCFMYSLAAGCFVERVEEKCGDEAARITRKHFYYVPDEILEACEESGNTYRHSFQLLDKKNTGVTYL